MPMMRARLPTPRPPPRSLVPRWGGGARAEASTLDPVTTGRCAPASPCKGEGGTEPASLRSDGERDEDGSVDVWLPSPCEGEGPGGRSLPPPVLGGRAGEGGLRLAWTCWSSSGNQQEVARK